MESRRTSAPPRWRLFGQHWLGFLVGALVVITLACGLGGFCWQYENLYEAQVAAAEAASQAGHSEPMPVRDWSIPVYKTFQLFLLNSGAEDDLGHPSNWLLWIARLSTVSLLIVLSLAAITNVVDQVRALPRQMTQRGHVVICGLGQIGLQILDDVLQLTPKRQVVVIENNPESPWLEHARQRGVAVVIGDATRADKLRILSGKPPVPFWRAVNVIRGFEWV